MTGPLSPVSRPGHTGAAALAASDAHLGQAARHPGRPSTGPGHDRVPALVVRRACRAREKRCWPSRDAHTHTHTHTHTHVSALSQKKKKRDFGGRAITCKSRRGASNRTRPPHRQKTAGHGQRQDTVKPKKKKKKREEVERPTCRSAHTLRKRRAGRDGRDQGHQGRAPRRHAGREQQAGRDQAGREVGPRAPEHDKKKVENRPPRSAARQGCVVAWPARGRSEGRDRVAPLFLSLRPCHGQEIAATTGGKQKTDSAAAMPRAPWYTRRPAKPGVWHEPKISGRAVITGASGELKIKSSSPAPGKGSSCTFEDSGLDKQRCSNPNSGTQGGSEDTRSGTAPQATRPEQKDHHEATKEADNATADSAKQEDWTKPAAMALPKRGLLS